MPEYLAPGVYVEETSFRAKSIEGVSTSTTGFVGPTRKGPVAGTPELLTSFGDFERIYGGLDDLGYGTNFLAHSVRAYFDNGGSRLYVSRVESGGVVAESEYLLGDATTTPSARFVARYSGKIGNGTVTIRQQEAPASEMTMKSASVGVMLRVGKDDQTKFYVKQADQSWKGEGEESLAETGTIIGDFLTVSVEAVDESRQIIVYEGLGLDQKHPAWIGRVLGESPVDRTDDLQRWIAISVKGNVSALDLRKKIFPGDKGRDQKDVPSITLPLSKGKLGDDGGAPGLEAYRKALQEFEKLEDISIVAAPGSSSYADGQGIIDALISHAERTRAYRIAVLDTPAKKVLSEARTIRGGIDSKYAALYYPWVVVSNPLASSGNASVSKELTLPPSGFVCGVYARNDIERGVHKAPANEIVRGALRFEQDINFAEQGVLNPIGVNCLRYLSGRGYRVWGARTVSSDPEWKYVNVRRYMNYLEASIDRGTQWAVFEPNGERLWANVRQTVTDFLYNEWVSGALLGASPKEAFLVRCDRSTMTQNDLDNGRLICLVGVAVLKPAEFVIFRIGQKTADERN